jgi:predicted phage tail protein
MSQELKTIRLKGRLGHEFGEVHRLAISDPAEGIRAMCHLMPNFEGALRRGQYRVSRITPDKELAIGEEELALSFGAAKGFAIEPVVGGSKNSGLGKVILGVALISFAWWAAPLAVGASAGTGVTATTTGAVTVGGISTAKIASIGSLMALQGAAALLTPTPTAPQVADQKESFMLDGTGNLLEQGNPVPIVFGEAFVGSIVVSAGITTDEMATEDKEPEVEEVESTSSSKAEAWANPTAQ